MSSDAVHVEAKRVLDAVVWALDERTLSRRIDEPIDAVLEDLASSLGPTRPAELLDVVEHFLQCVHEVAWPVRRTLTSSQARDEAMMLLRTGYQGDCPDGYSAAMVDVADEDSPGAAMVIAHLAETIKARCRQEYTRWVEAHWIDTASWSVRCAMVELLFIRLADVLPPSVTSSSPTHFADSVFDLLNLHLGTEGRMSPTSLAEFWRDQSDD